jgi:hypothetical protein
LISSQQHFCPSCHQKRVVEFGQWLRETVIKAVPHRHLVMGIPKILRRYFLYDRKLLSELTGKDAADSFRRCVARRQANHARIGPNKGLLPGNFRLTADLHLDIY